jgi:hypothetical protein
MAGNSSPWRALRPVFLAGAATLTWLTFSASAASADTLPDAASLLGGVTSSLSSVTEKLPDAVAAAPGVSAADPVSSPGLLQPLAGGVSGLADQIISTVPVVNQVVPAGTVSAVAVPAAQAVDAKTAGVVNAATPPVVEALPVLEPVLQPVADLVTGNTALPLPLPEEHVVAPNDEIPAQAPATAQSPAAPEPPVTTTGQADSEATATSGAIEASGTTTPSAGSVAATVAQLPLQAVVFAPDITEEQPRTGDPWSAPAQAPPASGSGPGSGTTSTGSSGSAGCLSLFTFDPSLTGAVRAGETSERLPAPVSFDPGSSPD